MSNELHNLETSLKEFLEEQQSDSSNSRNSILYKYNNLKIYMEPNRDKTPHFIIRIGISEATYNIASGEKISGGFGSEERLIRRWFDKAHVKSGLNNAWLQSKKVKILFFTNKDDED